MDQPTCIVERMIANGHGDPTGWSTAQGRDLRFVQGLYYGTDGLDVRSPITPPRRLSADRGSQQKTERKPMTTEQKFEQWAIVEVMGHSRYAGMVTEQAIGGASFIRVDVPEVDGKQAFTKLLGAGSIFAITPVTEEVARRAAYGFRAVPISTYDLPALPERVIDAGSRVNIPDDDDDDFDDDVDGDDY